MSALERVDDKAPWIQLEANEVQAHFVTHTEMELFSVEQLAAVRVQTIEECAKVCDTIGEGLDVTYDEECAPLVRALKGQKT